MKNKKILIILGILAIIIFLEYGVGIPCIFHKITGLYCPGCGITRAIQALMQLNFYQAIRYNALIILSPLYIYCMIKYNRTSGKIFNIVIYTLLIITILYGVLRNIPIFSFLAPTKIL